ncbi:DUF3558 domain-containing protein [Gordonia rubripertincta]|nr:DUF3558 domain-containing protein [Gordonia rubripertincta]
MPPKSLSAKAYVFAGCFVVGLLSGCTTGGTPTPASINTGSSPSTTAGIRQTDDSGRPLPFTTEFPNRWSINNNGTTYEPCTQVADNTVEQFGLQKDSVADVAGSDFQTARGCRWKYADGMSSIAQFVGNIRQPERGLDGYKSMNSVGRTWYPDTSINSRRVLVGSTGPGACSVYLQSSDAVVVTLVSRFEIPPAPTEEVCRTATDFLKATVEQIPR